MLVVCYLILIFTVAVKPLEVVTVILTVPAFLAVTLPFSSTVAMLLQAPPQLSRQEKMRLTAAHSFPVLLLKSAAVCDKIKADRNRRIPSME